MQIKRPKPFAAKKMLQEVIHTLSEIPASKDATTLAVVRTQKSQHWYEKGILTISVPAVPGYGEEPEVTPEPTATPAPSETPAPTATPEPPTSTPSQPRFHPARDNGIYNVNVISSSTMFHSRLHLTSKNGKMTTVLTLSGTGYDYLYVGTSEQAAKADSSKWFHIP